MSFSSPSLFRQNFNWFWELKEQRSQHHSSQHKQITSRIDKSEDAVCSLILDQRSSSSFSCNGIQGKTGVVYDELHHPNREQVLYHFGYSWYCKRQTITRKVDDDEGDQGRKDDDDDPAKPDEEKKKLSEEKDDAPSRRSCSCLVISCVIVWFVSLRSRSPLRFITEQL